jgi:hypothetical protein
MVLNAVTAPALSTIDVGYRDLGPAPTKVRHSPQSCTTTNGTNTPTPGVIRSTVKVVCCGRLGSGTWNLPVAPVRSPTFTRALRVDKKLIACSRSVDSLAVSVTWRSPGPARTDETEIFGRGSHDVEGVEVGVATGVEVGVATGVEVGVATGVEVGVETGPPPEPGAAEGGVPGLTARRSQWKRTVSTGGR